MNIANIVTVAINHFFLNLKYQSNKIIMKSKLLIIGILSLSCLTTYAGRHSSMFGGAAIGTAAGAGLGYAIGGGDSGVTALGAIIGGLSGAAIGSDGSHNHRGRHRHTHTERVYTCQPVQYRNHYYTEEVCRPVVETRRVYVQPVRERTVYVQQPSRTTCRTEVRRYSDYGAVYDEYNTVCY